MTMRWRSWITVAGVGAVLLALGGARPVHADDSCYDPYWHRRLHRELRDVHRDIHRDLNREHARWHWRHDDDWGDYRYRREHARLHRNLGHEHRDAHRDLKREHRRAHRYFDDRYDRLAWR
ncbi:MAG TPA: hypothetical protein VNJ09_07290 [Chthonomonadales bacterium]|nr:hypothetical protein [Chthonomonadales bacterium]